MVNDNVQAKIVELIDWIKTGVETNAPILYQELLYRQIATYSMLIVIFLSVSIALGLIYRYCSKHAGIVGKRYRDDETIWRAVSTFPGLGAIAALCITLGQTMFLVSTLVAPRVAVLEEVIRMVK